MHFASNIVRPPYEARSGFLQVTSGCTHDKCLFCTYYKDVPFKVSPIEEVEADLQELAPYNGRFDRIFLQGADPFVLKTDRLLKIAELIHHYLPSVQTIACFGRVTSFCNKTLEDIRALKEAGYGDIVIGIESGDDHVLEFMNKGYKSKDIIEQVSKLTDAGMTYTAIFLTGLGGHGYGMRHVEESLKVFNQLRPSRVQTPQLTLFPDTPLMEKVRDGSFVESTEEEKFLEARAFLQGLTIPTLFDAAHVSVSTPVMGHLPEDKEDMLSQMDYAMHKAGFDGLKRKRDAIYQILRLPIPKMGFAP